MRIIATFLSSLLTRLALIVPALLEELVGRFNGFRIGSYASGQDL
jgi:hypothetical protein